MQETQETQVRSLVQEDPLEKEMTTHSVFWHEKPLDRGAWGAMVHRVTESHTTKAT